MGWTPEGYERVIRAMQRRDDIRRELDIAKQNGLSTIRELEASMARAEDDLRQLQDAISSTAPAS
jgi:hypothetical protein